MMVGHRVSKFLALLLFKDFGFTMDSGYDLTSKFMKKGSDAKSGLFTMFEQVCPDKAKAVVKDVKSRMEEWDRSGNYGIEQIKYAALDAIVSLSAGVGGWKELDGPKWTSFNLSPVPKARLDLLVLVVITKKRLDQVLTYCFYRALDGQGSEPCV
jgi:hypothetical protein